MKGMKKWIFGACLLVVCAAFLFVPALMSTDTETRLADDPVAKRAALDRDLAEMRAEMKANGWDFQIGANPAMQYSIEQLCNFKPELKPLNSSAYEPGDSAIVAATLPTAFTGVWTSIKNQASCGSCWAFSTIAGLEAAILWKGGPALDLSEQHMVSCNPYDWGCSGGFLGFDMLVPSMGYYPGAMPETCFPYTALDSTCAYCASPTWYPVASWSYVGTSSALPSVDAIKTAIYTYGSVSAGIYVDRYFQAYTGGVLTSCKKRPAVSQSCHHPLRLGRRQGRLAAEELLGHQLGRSRLHVDQVRLQQCGLRRRILHLLRSCAVTYF